MNASKYHNLPDIDTSQPDVFQTDDVPEYTSRARDLITGEEDYPSTSKRPLDPEAIDTAQLPGRDVAGKAFSRKEKSLYTFRPRLPPITRPRASSSSSSDDEPVPHLKESSQAKLRRLKRELAELEQEVASGVPDEPVKPRRAPVDPASQPPVLDLVQEMKRIREGLDKLEIRPVLLAEGMGTGSKTKADLDERIAGLGAMQPEAGVGHASVETEPRPTGGEWRLSEMDGRLAELERIIGPADAGVDDTAPHAAPLIPTLAKLDHLLTLLTQPRHLDAISRRLKLLLVDLDRAAAISRRNGTALPSDTSPAPQTVTLSAADHANLTKLFNLLPRLDPLLPLLPPLLARLRSLAGLHAEASAFASTLRSLQADRTKLADRDTETRDVIEGLQKGLQEAEGAVKANWDVVGGRLAQLEDRVKALL